MNGNISSYKLSMKKWGGWGGTLQTFANKASKVL